MDVTWLLRFLCVLIWTRVGRPTLLRCHHRHHLTHRSILALPLILVTNSWVAFPRLSWKVNCEFWMPGVKVRSKKTQTNNKVRPDTQGYDSAVPFLLAMKSSSNTFSSKASMATKITSVRDGQLHYTFCATWTDDVTYAIPFSCLCDR